MAARVIPHIRRNGCFHLMMMRHPVLLLPERCPMLSLPQHPSRVRKSHIHLQLNKVAVASR